MFSPYEASDHIWWGGEGNVKKDSREEPLSTHPCRKVIETWRQRMRKEEKEKYILLEN